MLKTYILILLVSCFVLSSVLASDKIRLPDAEEETEERRNGRHLLDFIGLGTGNNVDPYLARSNENCLSGDLSDCFKSQALNSFGDFFLQTEYSLTPNVKIVRMPEYQIQSIENEPYEYASETRASDSEWDQLLKFALRKAEKFVKSAAFEVEIPEEIKNESRYSARFIDEIYDEIDVLEDKKAPLLTKHRLKKIFIPMLLILKLFKLKLLLFLPFIIGIAGFKKILGFVAFVLPGIFGYLKLCKPNLGFGHQYTPQYNANGVGGFGSAFQTLLGGNKYSYASAPSHHSYNDNIYRTNDNSGTVKFGDTNYAHDLPYQGYSEYRTNNNKKINSDTE